MSYTVLAVKWRPRRFATLVGQTDVVKALVNSLGAARLHHAYLFSGTRGVGKTTIARVLAKALNCETGVTPEPCGECSACVAIDEGRFVDLIEVDAASRTRVDDTRELLDNVQYMPTRGRYKVYLIDEVHMLSTHSFNALLKTLEEPPPHVKFLLATTDPQKLPVTVLSRCLQFNLKKLGPALIAEQLAAIADSEGITAEAGGLRAIAVSAAGSMRDALSLLDQAIAFGGGAIRESEVRQMLGSIDRDQVARILDALAAGDGAAMLGEVDRLDEQGASFPTVLDDLLAALQRIAVIQLVTARAVADEDQIWRPFAESIDPEDVQIYYQIALGGRRDIAICRDERVGFEMSLLRMLAFRPSSDAAREPDAGKRAATRSVAGPARGHTGTKPAVAAAAPQAPGARTATRPAQSGPPARAAEPGPAGGTAPAPVSAPAPAPARASPPASRPEPEPDSPPGADLSAVLADWPALLRAAALRGAVRNLADHCELDTVEGDRVVLVLQSDKANFNTEQLRQRLEQALARHLGQSLRLRILAGEPPRATPAERRRAGEDARMRETREAIEQDPNVQAVQAAFDAVLEPDSIQPAQRKH